MKQCGENQEVKVRGDKQKQTQVRNEGREPRHDMKMERLEREAEGRKPGRTVP